MNPFAAFAAIGVLIAAYAQGWLLPAIGLLLVCLYLWQVGKHL
ncbi:hypothetical protein [Pelagovum pacificum]|nr:hypothetical protein [Pelagovum pacificum]